MFNEVGFFRKPITLLKQILNWNLLYWVIIIITIIIIIIIIIIIELFVYCLTVFYLFCASFVIGHCAVKLTH